MATEGTENTEFKAIGAFQADYRRRTHISHDKDSSVNSVSSVANAFYFGNQRRSSRELLTTDTELKAMAAPATTGLSRPKAARGMPSTL